MRERSAESSAEGMARGGATLSIRNAVVVALLVCTSAAPALGQVASALIREGDAFPDGGAGHVVNSLGNTAVNHVGGYAVGLNSTDTVTTLSHIWGNAAGGAPATLRTEITITTHVQTSFEDFYGMSDAGQLAYSAICTIGGIAGFDSVWLDDTPLAVEESPVTALPGYYWSFASRPSVSADGVPHWVGGITSTPGGATQNRVLATTVAGTIELAGGDTPTGLPFPIDTGSSGIDFDYRYSALSNHYILPVVMDTGSTTNDGAVVVDGAGLVVGGTLVREGDPVPAAVGGLPGENWDNFDFVGHTEAGQWFFTGDTDGATATDEIIVKDGVIIGREGDTLDGHVLSGAIEGAYMNDDGDVAFIWDIEPGPVEALYINDRFLLAEGDDVDWDGDGTIDPGYTLTDFTGISSMTISDRNATNDVDVYFTADVVLPTGGTLEGFFRLTEPSVPVELVSFTVE